MNIDTSTGLVLVLFFAMFMGGAILWFWRIRQINTLASIVTVIGVLGTFVGIAIGLWQFDTNEIKDSVPKLLDGLKIAFFTSILGIIGSIWLKWSALNKQKKQEVYTGATVDDLAGLLRDILAVEQEEGNETRNTLRAIERSLTGEGDSTVLTQLQKLRTTVSDKQDDLIHSFNEFADQMAENNTNALIEALEGVMRDFNARINEQFGDNFKQLNEAVGRINEWQEQYRQQMDELAVQFQVTAASIEKSRESLEIIAERSGSIVSNSEKLEPILQALQHQTGQLNGHLTAFDALADNALNAFPIIENRLNQLTNDFSNVVRETIDNSHASMDRQRESLNNFISMVKESIDNSQADMVRHRSAIEDFTGRIEAVIRSTHEGLESAIEKTNRELESTLQTQSRQLSTETERIFQLGGERMTQQIQLLDTALQEELTRALDSLGSQLASLSRRFVDDYSPLTEKLRDVVQMASSVPQTSRYRDR